MSAPASAALDSVLREIMRTGKVIIGFRKTLKNVKLGKVRAVVVASKIPREMFSDIVYNARISEIPVIVFEGGSMDLGAAVGKPFPVSSIGIIDPGSVSIEKLREFAKST